MKKQWFNLVLSVMLVFMFAGCNTVPPAATPSAAVAKTTPPASPPTPTPAPEPMAAYKGEFRDMTAQELLKELGPGYAYIGLGMFDFTLRYDPYPSMPVVFDFGLNILDGDHGYNWSSKLSLGESVPVSFSLEELPDIPDGLRYNHFDLSGGVRAWQDIPMTIKVENARIELPGQTIYLTESNGTFEAVALDSTRYDKGSAWLFTGLSNGSLPDLLDADTLKQGNFRADVTLLQVEGPSKADYYSHDGLLECMPEPTAEWFKFLKSEGFNSIRFHVTWSNQTNDETYEIDKAWLEKVAQTIDLALENDLYCSINVAWDMCTSFHPLFTGGMSEAEVAALPFTQGWLTLDGDPKVEQRFASVWRQIAEYFKEYDEHLIFESMNEPNAPDSTMEALGAVGDPGGHGWADLGNVGDNLNRLNQIFVDSVRATGGNNESRFLFVPPFMHRGVERYLSKFQLPSDPASHVIVCINYYLGDDTSVGGGDPFPSIEKYLIANGVPVVFTEFGSSADEFSYEERVDFTRKAVARANELGMPIMWYAGGWGEAVENSPSFCLYNPYTFEKEFPELIDILMHRTQ